MNISDLAMNNRSNRKVRGIPDVDSAWWGVLTEDAAQWDCLNGRSGRDWQTWFLCIFSRCCGRKKMSCCRRKNEMNCKLFTNICITSLSSSIEIRIGISDSELKLESPVYKGRDWKGSFVEKKLRWDGRIRCLSQVTCRGRYKLGCLGGLSNNSKAWRSRKAQRFLKARKAASF